VLANWPTPQPENPDDHPQGWFFVVRYAAMVFGLCIKKAKKEVLT